MPCQQSRWEPDRAGSGTSNHGGVVRCGIGVVQASEHCSAALKERIVLAVEKHYSSLCLTRFSGHVT